MDGLLFDCHSLEEHTQAIADFLPNGDLFRAKNIDGSITRLFLKGLAYTNKDAESFLKLFDEAIDIKTTTAFLEGWEKTVGIPDNCFSTETDLETRRQQVLMKLASLGVQTNKDFVDLAAIYDIDIRIESGAYAGVFPMTFPIILFDSPSEARFTMLIYYSLASPVVFPYTFPLMFSVDGISIIECLFRKLVPANVDLIFIEEPVLFGDSFSDGFSDGFS